MSDKVNAVLQNFHEDSERGINKQINMELHASYVYQALAFQFERHDVALKGFAKFFHESSLEERGHAEKLMKYLNDRGGRIVLEPVNPPEKYDYDTGLGALEASLALERKVNESLLKLHTLASKHDDPHLTDFIEEHFLDEQVHSIKLLGDHITNLKRVGPGLGEFQFDKLTMNSPEDE